MEISLTNKTDKKMLISPEDHKLISQYNWYENKQGYAQAITNKHTLAHRLIMNNPIGNVVDHQNRNRLDNRKDNLRIYTPNLNGKNKSVQKTKKGTQYRGVYYREKNIKPYNARLYYNKKQHTVGRFDTELEAAEAFDMYILYNNMEGVELNFPDKKEDYLKRNFAFPKRKRFSSYNGVTFDKNWNKYKTVIRHNNKDIRIHSSTNEIECAKAYDKYIVDNNIPAKELNFPNDYPNYNRNSIIKTNCKSINETLVQLLINNDTDIVVTIDKEDYDKVKYYAWYKSSNKYITAQINENTVKLHRYIMNEKDPNILIDHKDSNIYNNSKNNLRKSNIELNTQNKRKRENTTSQYIGVSKAKKRWVSQVAHKRIGSDRLEILAARRRDLYIMENLPDSHYKMNFEWTPEDIEMWKLALRI